MHVAIVMGLSLLGQRLKDSTLVELLVCASLVHFIFLNNLCYIHLSLL